MSAEETLAKIAKDVSVCTKCALHEGRKKAVPGEGPATVEIMFIGRDRASMKTSRGVHSWGRRASFWINCWHRQA
jgi:uracil-DNA glycosylase